MSAEQQTTTGEEEKWIESLRAGDASAFDCIVLRFQDTVYNLCFRMTGDREEAADCAQEVFVKVYRAIGRFRFQSKFSTWLYAVAVNTCKNRMGSAEFRHRSRLVPIDSTADKETAGIIMEIEDPSPSPLANLTQKERDRLVQGAINSLPEEARTVVTLRDIEGLSYDEIAAITGYNPGTVKSKLARARHQLREKLEGVI